MQMKLAAVVAATDLVRVAPNGRSVTGGVYAPNGDLWLLEYSVTNAARVRRIRHC